MPVKRAGLANKPRKRKSSSASNRTGSTDRKTPDQRKIRIPVVGGGKPTNKPGRKPRGKAAIPGCLVPISVVALGVVACLVLALSF